MQPIFCKDSARRTKYKAFRRFSPRNGTADMEDLTRYTPLKKNVKQTNESIKMTDEIKKRKKCFVRMKIIRTFASLLRGTGALSSAGSERLPYKQRVGGSNPSAPTRKQNPRQHPYQRALSSAGSERLPYKQRVGGSNPSAPTRKQNPRQHPYQRALSSAGSERLPYKQRVGGSNPSAPTQRISHFSGRNPFLLSFFIRQ